MFKLMGRLGDTGVYRFPIGSGLKEFRAPFEGNLHLFVNEVVFAGKLATLPYTWSIGRNMGAARVTVTRLE